MIIERDISDIEREIEDTKTDISWSDNPSTIAILEENLEILYSELENALSEF